MRWLVKMKSHEQKTCSDFINFSLSFFKTPSKLHIFSRINRTSKDFFPLLPSVCHRNISSRCCSSLLNRRLVFSKIWQGTGGSEEAHLVKPTSLTGPITKTQQDCTEAPGSTFPFFLKPPHWALRKCAERLGHFLPGTQVSGSHSPLLLFRFSLLLFLRICFKGIPISVSSEGLSAPLPDTFLTPLVFWNKSQT